MRPVGVFRDASIRDVADTATLLNLHAVQLHGAEDLAYVRALRRELPPSCEIWTAVSIGRQPLESRGGDRMLFDNGTGGTGSTFDWSLVEGHPELSRAIVAGGISRHNVVGARQLGAYALDIGSSMDFRPGRKSPVRIAALFEALRPTTGERVQACD